ncbi:hypothetical protein B0H14DRAFT_2629893 [Mycena olivaceomarginata]|nr:hypothetical protein B0H14DRAFT_2629893 [Mycena olivaceomarginata]
MLSFAPKNDKKLATDEPSCTVEPRVSVQTKNDKKQLRQRMSVTGMEAPVFAASGKGTSISLFTATKMDDISSGHEAMTYSEKKKGLVGKSTIKTRCHTIIFWCRAEKKAKRRQSDKPRKKSEPTTGMRDASESLVLMSKLHTPKSVCLGFRKDVFENWQDSPRVYEGRNSSDSEEDEMGVQSSTATARRNFLKGWKKTLPRRSQSPKRARAQETLGSDAAPVVAAARFGGPDAKSN